MKNDVFITGTSCFFPNEPILNEDMEDFLGLIAGKHSRVKPIILKQNGIKQRYYALTKILQKSGIQKNEVIELIYRGFI
jgi:3-oxoacyl-[acyl-carrier-protein] synthase-3